ncbi:hypothetical protein P792_11305 [Asaia sp. SF2.1]|nr:hypothetical protein P792_11305 [Asaia sp. SF2.1]
MMAVSLAVWVGRQGRSRDWALRLPAFFQRLRRLSSMMRGLILMRL